MVSLEVIEIGLTLLPSRVIELDPYTTFDVTQHLLVETIIEELDRGTADTWGYFSRWTH